MSLNNTKLKSSERHLGYSYIVTKPVLLYFLLLWSLEMLILFSCMQRKLGDRLLSGTSALSKFSRFSVLELTLTLPGPSAGVGGSLTVTVA